MARENFKSVESNEKLTLPTVMSFARLFGGAALGYALARNNIDPNAAFATAAVLGATDAEGNVIQMARRAPRLQKALRIVPTTFGRLMDPVADKVFAVSVFAGGAVGGYIEPKVAIPILATEVATAASTGIVKAVTGEEPQVTTAGKAGMVGRCAAMGTALLASGTTGNAQEALEAVTYAVTGASVVLGSISCGQIIRNVFHRQPEQPA